MSNTAVAQGGFSEDEPLKQTSSSNRVDTTAQSNRRLGFTEWVNLSFGRKMV